MTANQFTADILRIRNRLRDVSDDIELEATQILYWLNQRRATYISQLQKYHINDQFYQDMGCVPFCRIGQDECDNITWGCNSLKFEEMPQLVFRADMDDVLRINLVNKITRIYYQTPSTMRGRLSTAIGRSFNLATIIGKPLYLVPAINQWENFSVANMQVIAAEPEKVLKYNADGTTTPFDFFEDDYPCDPGVLAQIKLQILTQECKISMAMLADETNNSRDDT